MAAVHEYFEHGADIGVVGRGASIEQAFAGAAASMFAIMVDPAAVRPRVRVGVDFDEDDVELALVRWLNGLLADLPQSALAAVVIAAALYVVYQAYE